MSTAFSRSMRTMGADGFRRSAAGIVAAAALLAIWTGWALLSRITLLEVSGNARVEVDRAVYPVQAPMLGRVVRSELAVGREVKAGEVLVELEAVSEQHQVREQGARLGVLTPELAALRAQLVAEQQAREEDRTATLTAIEQARAQAREAQAPARYAEEEARRLAKLRSEGLIAEREYQRGRSEAERQRAAVESSEIAVRRIEQEHRTRESEREARMRRLEAEITKIEGQVATMRSEMPRLEYEVERRKVRAAVSGRLGEVALLRAGAVVQDGEKLGAIVPDGTLKVVAQYVPAAAIGRVHAGQKARMRLDGFPWTQYGTVEATVSRVASEVREGMVRVELEADASNSRIPLQHGLPGSVEIEVERISPAALVMRASGRWLAEPRSAHVETAQMGRPMDRGAR